jgi:hypothetical protein
LWLFCFKSSEEEDSRNFLVSNAFCNLTESEGTDIKKDCPKLSFKKGTFMSKYMTKSKATQMSSMQQAHKAQHSGSIPIAVLTHENIANRAYEIYVENGCREGHSEQNWLQSEQELKSKQNWLQANQK